MAKKRSKKRTTRKRPASKKRTTKRASNTRKKTTKATTKRGQKLGSVSTDALATELRRRQKDLGRLEAKRDKLAAQLAEVEREINAVGGAGGFGTTARGSIRRRPRNDTNLADALVAVLKGKTMGVSEVADAVLAAGYRTSAANFRTIVNQTLLRDKRIKKISRGQYTAK
ncbi:MAG: hypothetical protein DHS20C14_05120 [Phycisphaeraceae bacterium]|nr:MAG: hypothetical protein DHS20C14_05120 [Phycisphaeraceae bacterium]